MAGSQFNFPSIAPLSNGNVQANSKLYTYLTGSSTPAATYTTPDLSVQHSNPVVADSTGVFPPIYLDPSLGRYRVTWKTSGDVELDQFDNVLSEQNNSQSYTIQSAAPYIDLIETDASADNGAWRIKANGEQLVIYAANDALSVFTPVLSIDRTGTTVDTLNLTATANQINGTQISDVFSSTFTPTWTGFSSSPTGTVSYTILGSKLAIITFGANCTGTSNSTSMAITNIPLALRPKITFPVNPTFPYFTAVDNGAACIATAGLSGTSTFDFYKGTAPPSSTGWTNPGTNGFGKGAQIVYSLI